jgi:hypothetical protein
MHSNELVQLSDAGDTVLDASGGQLTAVLAADVDVVMAFRPVHANKDHAMSTSSRLRIRTSTSSQPAA